MPIAWCAFIVSVLSLSESYYIYKFVLQNPITFGNSLDMLISCMASARYWCERRKSSWIVELIINPVYTIHPLYSLRKVKHAFHFIANYLTTVSIYLQSALLLDDCQTTPDSF